MKKYYIGLAVIAVLVLGLSGYAVAQAAGSRADKVTDRRYKEIAEDLNSYVSKQQKIPSSLKDAGIKDAPSTIRYSKKSDSSYEFCATYKKASDSYGGGIESVFSGSALASFSSKTPSYSDFSNGYSASSLYPPYSHKQGENCQTVEPYLYSGSFLDSKLDNYQYDSSYFTSPTTTTSGTANDTERQTDIKALHGQLEAYYAQKGYYPTLDNLNDAAWRSTNMKGLDSEALKDPKGSSAKIASYPTNNAYSYDVVASDGGSCDNTSYDCTEYTLTAVLSNGTDYTKKSLN